MRKSGMERPGLRFAERQSGANDTAARLPTELGLCRVRGTSDGVRVPRSLDGYWAKSLVRLTMRMKWSVKSPCISGTATLGIWQVVQ